MGCILEQTSPVHAEAKGRRFFFLSFRGRLIPDDREEIPFLAAYEPFSGWKIQETPDLATFSELIPEGYFQAFCLDVLKESHNDFLVRWRLDKRDGKLQITKLRSLTSQSIP